DPIVVCFGENYFQKIVTFEVGQQKKRLKVGENHQISAPGGGSDDKVVQCDMKADICGHYDKSREPGVYDVSLQSLALDLKVVSNHCSPTHPIKWSETQDTTLRL